MVLRLSLNPFLILFLSVKENSFYKLLERTMYDRRAVHPTAKVCVKMVTLYGSQFVADVNPNGFSIRWIPAKSVMEHCGKEICEKQLALEIAANVLFVTTKIPTIIKTLDPRVKQQKKGKRHGGQSAREMAKIDLRETLPHHLMKTRQQPFQIT